MGDNSCVCGGRKRRRETGQAEAVGGRAAGRCWRVARHLGRFFCRNDDGVAVGDNNSSRSGLLRGTFCAEVKSCHAFDESLFLLLQGGDFFLQLLGLHLQPQLVHARLQQVLLASQVVDAVRLASIPRSCF